MAAGDYTMYGRADQPDTGRLQVAGQSAATAADVTFTLGFEPMKVTFRAIGAAGATVGNIYTYLKAIGTAINELVTASSGAVTFVTTTNRAITVQQNATTGAWEVTILSGVQTNSHYYVVEIER